MDKKLLGESPIETIIESLLGKQNAVEVNVKEMVNYPENCGEDTDCDGCIYLTKELGCKLDTIKKEED